MFSQEEIKLASKVVMALKKLGWKEWDPQVGEWYSIQLKNLLPILELVTKDNLDSVKQSKTWKRLTPLLHWEKLEEILEGMGYRLTVGVDPEIRPFKTGFECWIGTQEGAKKYQQFAYIKGIRTRQEAVMLAVIELGKER